MDDAGIILVLVAFAAGVGLLARSRGRNYWGYMALSILLSPLIGLIVVLVLKNLKQEDTTDEIRRQEHESHIASIKALQARPAVSAHSSGHTHVADELAKLAELRDKAVLTEAEFRDQKASLLRAR